MAANPYLSKAYINGVYIPSAILIVGSALVKKEWLPYAVAIALVLGGVQVLGGGARKLPLPPGTNAEY